MKSYAKGEILLLGLLWGPGFLFIELGIQEISPLSLVAARIVVGALFLYGLLRIKKRSLPPFGRVWARLFVMSLLSQVFPWSLYALAQLRITSAVAGIINGLVAIATAVIAHVVLQGEQLNKRKSVGLLITLSGFLTISLPRFFNHGVRGDLLGILGALIAMLCSATALAYAKRHLRDLPPLVGPTAQLFCAACVMLPVAYFFGPLFPRPAMTWLGFACILELGIIGTGCTYILYYGILRHSGATNLAMAYYLLPIFSTLLGVLILHERLHWSGYAGGLLILLGMMTFNGTLRLPAPTR